MCYILASNSFFILMIILARMMKKWSSPVYAFFYPKPEIEDGKQRCHVFKCFAEHCKGKGKEPRLIRCYLDTGDRNSTGSLHKHAKACWGEDAVQQVDETKNLTHAWEVVKRY